MFRKKLGIVRFKNGRTEKIILQDRYWDSEMNNYTLVETKAGKYLCVETREYMPVPFADDNPVISLRYVYRFFKLDLNEHRWVFNDEIKTIELVPPKGWLIHTSKNNKPFVKIKSKNSKKERRCE